MREGEQGRGERVGECAEGGGEGVQASFVLPLSRFVLMLVQIIRQDLPIFLVIYAIFLFG